MKIIEKDGYYFEASAGGGRVTIFLGLEGCGGRGFVLTPEEAREVIDGLEASASEARSQQHEAEAVIE